MEPFSFEHTLQFTEDLYVRLNSLFLRKTRLARLLLVTVAGILCLFWPYTILLGIVLLFMTGLMIFLSGRIPNTVANNFRTMNYLHDELTYGVSENTLWIKSPRLSIDVKWELAAVWDEREGWLKISPHYTPNIWLPTDKLREAGIYDNIIELCKKHAVKFGSKKVALNR